MSIDVSPETVRVPDPGNIVQVRGSTWAVTDVRAQGLLRSPADETSPHQQHVVDLQSLDEDRLGEELSVIWELEVGHTIAPERGLPEQITADGFDDPNDLAAIIDAVRWGAVTSADKNAYQAPFRSGANVEAYQLEPLRRALSSPRTNLLLADDVGLGKTVEAGLVVQELLLRHRARTVIVVCPPSLMLKWQDEMREKFGLDFMVVNSALLAQIRRSHGLNANPFRLFPRVIVSMAWLPKARAQRMLRDIFDEATSTSSARQFAFDVLVVDEAHHVAPASPSSRGSRRVYAVDSQRTIATKHLADKCEHRLFLSATPHNGHSESFTALLSMIDNRRFSRGATVDEKALKEVTVRRLKTEITEKDFKARQVRPLPFVPTDDEEQMYDLLDDILTRSAVKNGDKRKASDITALLLKKRFLSSPWSFARTLAMVSSAPSSGSETEWGDDFYDDIFGSGQDDEEEGRDFQLESLSLVKAQRRGPLSAATSEQIEQLISWGESYQHQADSRLGRLREFLEATCRPDGTTWSNERVVVFTEYAATCDWLVDILRSHGFDASRLEVIQGSTDPEERELIRARFSAPPDQEPVRVLVATDSAGEGIDLQAHCHRLVNFDIPFNPSRLEQRIGRIDRYGQKHAPEIFNLVPVEGSSTYDNNVRFLTTVAHKIATVAVDLGSANLVLDAQIQQELLGRPRTQGRSRHEVNEHTASIINRTLAGGIELNKQLTRLASQYEARRDDLHWSPFNARRAVDTALRFAQQPTLEVGGDQDTDAQIFEIPDVSPQWHNALKGLDTRLEPGVYRPITFDDHAAAHRSDLVYVHLGHALMQKSNRLLRNTLFSADTPVNRVTAVVVDDVAESCVAAVSRLVLVGRGGLRLHEEVFVSGVRLKGRKMAEEKLEKALSAALDHPNLELAPVAVREHFAALWNDDDAMLRSRLDDTVETRASRLHQSVEERLAKSKDNDLDRARGIFSAFRSNLRDSLSALKAEDPDGHQLPLFSDEERRQRWRDIEAMEARLDQLDDEQSNEVASINARYADIKPYVSSAAVVFALTTTDADEIVRGA